VALEIQDEGGKLDLNRVQEERQRQALDRLFQSLDLPPQLLDALAMWTSPDAEAAAARGGQECRLDIPCVPPRGGLRSIEDLRLIPGFDDRTMSLLRPFVTAHPGRAANTINVNTAPAIVLQALGCGVGADFAPPPGGYESVAEFSEDVTCEGAPPLGVQSNLFSILASGTVGDTTQTVLAVVERSQSRAKRLTWLERSVFDLAPAEVG
jgi:general secretion pathway protein K